MHTQNQEPAQNQESDLLLDRAEKLTSETVGQSRFLTGVLDAIFDRVYLKDSTGRIVYVNRAYLDSYDLAAEEVLGKFHPDFLPAEQVSVCHAADQKVLQQGESLCQESDWLESATGTQHWSMSYKSPLRDVEGKVIGLVGICRDLTEAKETQQRLKRNEALLLHASRLSTLGELAAQIAHEVNQPLFSILNYAKAVENALESEEAIDLETVRTWVRQIRNEATRGGKITQRLKSFIQPADTQQEQADLNLVVRESIELMTWEAREVAVSIEIELAEDLPTLLVDRIQIQQVMVNLLKNALEALFQCSVSTPCVVVSTRRVPTGVEVTVSDNGPGVTVEESVNLFDPFETTKPGGLGLGLAICTTIIEAHKGHLKYHPNPWGGVTFSFTLPLET